MATQSETNRINDIDLDVLGETVTAIKADPDMGKCKFRARNTWLGGNHNMTEISDFYAGKEEMTHKKSFKLHADEPNMLAGHDQAANPVEHLLEALAGCLTTSMVAHAAVNGINIESLESSIEGDIDMRGYLGISNDIPKGFTNVRVAFKVKSDAKDAETLRRLAMFSPVCNTMTQGVKVDVKVELNH